MVELTAENSEAFTLISLIIELQRDYDKSESRDTKIMDFANHTLTMVSEQEFWEIKDSFDNGLITVTKR